MQRLSLQFNEKPVQSILQQDNHKVIQLSFEAGQTLVKHETGNTLMLVVLQGAIHFTVEGQTQRLDALDMLVVEPHKEHNVEAIEKSIVLLILLADAASYGEHAAKEQPLDHENAYQNPQLIEQIAEELRPLTQDHIELCKTIEAVHGVADQAALQRALDQISDELKRHFVAEERHVFPLMAKHVGGVDVGPVARLLEEHEKIRKLSKDANTLYQVFSTKPDAHVAELLEQKWRDLSRTLLNHLGKEDSHLFPMASRLFTADEKAALALALREYDYV